MSAHIREPMHLYRGKEIGGGGKEELRMGVWNKEGGGTFIVVYRFDWVSTFKI